MNHIMGRMGPIFVLAMACIAADMAGGQAGKEGTPRRSSEELRAATVCYHRGLEAVRAGNWEAAAALMRASHELNPQFLPARFWMGRIKFEQKNWAGAEEDFKGLLTVNPRSPETHYWLGRVLEAAGRTKEACQHYQIALQAGLKGEDGRDAAARLQALSPGATTLAQGPPLPPPLVEPTVPPKPEEAAREAPGPAEPAATAPLEPLKPAPADQEVAGEEEFLPGTEEPSEVPEPLPGMKEPVEEEPVESRPPVQPVPPTPQEEPLAVPRLDGAAVAAALREKLRPQQRLQVLILGDTFTAAPGVADPPQGGYAALFADLLRARFADLDLQVQVQGLPNALAAQGWAALQRSLRAARPDLVVLHFGAYDQVGNVPLRAFQNTLRQMVAAVVEAGPTALILATPLVEGPPGGPYVQAVKEVARQAGAPVADFEAAVKGQGQDHRGLFPFGQHPHEYAHTAAARELYRAFQSLIGEPETLGLALEGPLQYAPLGADMLLPVRISNRGPNPTEGQLKVLMDGRTVDKPFTVQPGQEEAVEVPWQLPTELPNGRALQIRLLAEAEAGDTSAVEARWASVAPVLACPKVPGLIQFDETGTWAEKLPRHTLGPGHVVTGQVDHPADCGALFSLARDEEAICLFLEVQDDQYQPTGSNIAAFNDCVELMFDLRPQEQRGQPFNTPQVFLLFVQLPADDPGEAVIVPLDTRPPGLEQVEAVFTPMEEGYRLQVALPLSFLEQAAGGKVDRFGFDLAIDDADTPGQRQAQLVWSGRADNFVNPRNFGEVNLKAEKEEKQVRVTVW